MMRLEYEGRFNEKQANEGDVPQKKRKRSLNTNEQAVKCNACDKVFIT